MAIVAHPLAAVNNNPIYTADAYRHAVNSLLLPCDGTPFGCVSGVRYTGTGPIISVNGVTVSTQPHAGFYAGWESAGVYTYSAGVERVDLPNKNGNYKVYVQINDPSQGHGETPGGQLSVVDASVPDSNINGVVLATINNGVVSETAIRVDAGGNLYAPSFDVLNRTRAVEGTRAYMWKSDAQFVCDNGRWVQLNPHMQINTVWADPMLVHVALQPLDNSISAGGSNVNGATHLATLYFWWEIKGASQHNSWEPTTFAHFNGWIATSEGWGPVYANTSNDLSNLRCYVNGQDISLRSRANYTLFAPNWYQGSVVFPCKRA